MGYPNLNIRNHFQKKLKVGNDKPMNAEEKYYMATQWQLMGRKFKKHKLAIIGLTILSIMYFIALFCEFFSTQDIIKRNTDYLYVSPQKIHFVYNGKIQFRPFVYGIKKEEDPVTWAKVYAEDKSVVNPIYFFAHGDKYKLWGLFSGDLHLMTTKSGPFYIFGTDESGRDMFSRIIYASRISLFTGLVGVSFSFILGCLFGGISGYYGGSADIIIQRVIEFLISIPAIPLWMALSASMPKNWTSLQVYFCITVILSIIGWCGLARVVRGKLLELREEDYVLAAKLAGASDSKIITRHLLPGFMSYLIVNMTLAIPSMILGETSLSFLGIGLRAPVVSWGVLLKSAQDVKTISLHPWLLIPGIFIVITVLTFNFLGDGLRDAADPYK